ncbi:L,D-transpeptidase [Limimaricola sp.]|uniref:L,D-transpeptidase n=1 Tax=Limimaricola sp. TaxID=2211665 RepID=UPI004058C9D6
MTQTRRAFMATGAAGLVTLAAPAIAASDAVQRNVSALQKIDWRDHFDALGRGIIVADTGARAVHYWGGDGETYRLYPSSVPVSPELTKLGYTEVVRKVEGPTWTPTPSMRERDPSLPRVVPAGPGNPLGTHALYLSWQYYRIHGTHDTRKIGRPSSDGCIGLYNEHIAKLFALVEVGTQVRLI